MWTSKVYLISWRYFRAAATLNQMARAARSRDSLFGWLPLNVFVVIRSSWAVLMQFCFFVFLILASAKVRPQGFSDSPLRSTFKALWKCCAEEELSCSNWSMLIWKFESTRKNLENFKLDEIFIVTVINTRGQFSSPSVPAAQILKHEEHWVSAFDRTVILSLKTENGLIV